MVLALFVETIVWLCITVILTWQSVSPHLQHKLRCVAMLRNVISQVLLDINMPKGKKRKKKRMPQFYLWNCWAAGISLSLSRGENRGVRDSLARALVTGRLKLWPTSDSTATGQSTQRQTGTRRPGSPAEDINDQETKKWGRKKHNGFFWRQWSSFLPTEILSH